MISFPIHIPCHQPKANLTNALAQVLDISPQAFDVPHIDSYIGLMHTLFTLENIYGLTVSEADEEVFLKVNKNKGREEYDKWRYHYPEYDTTQIWAKVS